MSLRSNYFASLLFGASPGISLTSDTLKVMLVTSAYTPNPDDKYVSAITGGTSKELSGTGYTAGFGGSGRKTLASVVVAEDDTNDLGTFTAANVTWTAINAGTVAYAVIVKEVTDDAHSPIVAVLTISPAITTNGGDYTIQWSAGGILTV